MCTRVCVCVCVCVRACVRAYVRACVRVCVCVPPKGNYHEKHVRLADHTLVKLDHNSDTNTTFTMMGTSVKKVDDFGFSGMNIS